MNRFVVRKNLLPTFPPQFDLMENEAGKEEKRLHLLLALQSKKSFVVFDGDDDVAAVVSVIVIVDVFSFKITFLYI